jgi:hypothetical protein
MLILSIHFHRTTGISNVNSAVSDILTYFVIRNRCKDSQLLMYNTYKCELTVEAVILDQEDIPRNSAGIELGTQLTTWKIRRSSLLQRDTNTNETNESRQNQN